MKKRTMPRLTSLSLLIVYTVFLARPAYAYLDPGTASMLLQGIIGGVAAAGAVISMNYQRIKHAIHSRFGRKKGTDK